MLRVDCANVKVAYVGRFLGGRTMQNNTTINLSEQQNIRYTTLYTTGEVESRRRVEHVDNETKKENNRQESSTRTTWTSHW